MKAEITSYAVVQKEARGLDVAIEKGRQRMARYQVTPNTFIMVPEMQLYLSMIPADRIVYNQVGERGPARFDSYQGNQAWTSFRGLQCFTSNPFDGGDSVDTVQMLRRRTQIGEFYVMRPPVVVPNGELPSGYMDLIIYDEHKDRLAHITFREVVMHAMPWKVVGGMAGDPLGMMEATKEHKEKIDKTTDKALPAEARAAAKAHFNNGSGSTLNFEWWSKTIEYVEAGVWAPVMFVVTRPFIEHAMLSGILMVAGADTGATLFGPADMQISANTTVKTLEGHYTCHTKAVITKPQNVMVLRDIQCDEYIAGSDVTWFGDLSAKSAMSSMFSGDDTSDTLAEGIRNDLKERLDFDHEDDNQYASMFSFVCPFGERLQMMQDHAFSLTSMSAPWDIGNGERGERNFPGGSKFFDKYNDLFGLNEIVAGMDPGSLRNRDFVRNGTHNNSIVLMGPHRSYSPYTGTFYNLTPGQGHFGGDALPGDARWRRGEAVDVDSARSGVMGIEALQDASHVKNRVRST